MPRFGSVVDMGKKDLVWPSWWRRILGKAAIKIWASAYRLHNFSVGLIPYRPINGNYDGARFNDETPQLCADRLEMLRAAGYNVPQYAIERLRKESVE